MKKTFAILLAFVMVFSLLAGCGGSDKEDTGTKKGEPETATAEEAKGFEPVSATLGGYDVTVVGAELFTDTDDKDGIRVYWDFTNTSDETIYAYCDLSVKMEQEGFELNTTYVYSEDDVPEYGNDTLDLRPGVSIRCISEYNCKADGEPISFTIYDWYDEDDALTVEFDPKNLPGRPEKDLEIEPISDPAWTEGMDVEGYVGEDAYVVIESAEVVPGWDSGEEVIRVYFTYTNESEEASSFWWATNYRAFQDGIELTEDWADEDVEEDENASLDIEPGNTVYCSVCWELRSDSPVEIEVYDSWTEEYIGYVFEVE